jgi:hypothetical protein
MADGWVSDLSAVTHESWQGLAIDFSEAAGLERDRCSHRANLDQPPRVLLTCDRGGAALLWAPGKLYTFRGPDDPNAAGGVVGAASRRVIPIYEGADADDRKPKRVARWVDLASAKLWSAPALEPLALAAFAGVESKALAASRRGRTSDVWLLDFEAGTRALVARIDDCSGELTEIGWGAHAGPRYLVLACMTPEPPSAVVRALAHSALARRLLPERARRAVHAARARGGIARGGGVTPCVRSLERLRWRSD